MASNLARRWVKERRRAAARFEELLALAGAGEAGVLARLAAVDALRDGIDACRSLTREAAAAAAAAAAAGGGAHGTLQLLADEFEEELQLKVRSPRVPRCHGPPSAAMGHRRVTRRPHAGGHRRPAEL